MRLLILLMVSFQLFCSFDDEINDWNREHLLNKRPRPLSEIVQICNEEWGPESHILVNLDKIPEKDCYQTCSWCARMTDCMKGKGASWTLQMVTILGFVLDYT